MAEQRQPFRFRLPWLAPERPAAQPQRRRPSSETPQPPWRPAAAGLTPQPASRRAAPPQPARQTPPKADPPADPPAAPQPPRASPSQAGAKATNATSKPTSPSKSSSSLASEIPKTLPSSQVSKPSPSSQAATESTKAASKPASSPKSPSSTAAEISKASTSSQSPKPSAATIESTKTPTTKPTSPLKSPSPTAKIPKTDPDSASPVSGSTSKGPTPSKSTSPAAPPSTEPPKSAPQQSPKQSFDTVKQESLSRVPNESPKVNPKLASPPAPARTQSREAVSPSKGDAKSKTGSNSKVQPEPKKPPQPKEPSSSAPEEPKRAISQEPLQEPEPKAKLLSATTKSPTSMARERTSDSLSGKVAPASNSGIGEDQKPVAGEPKETEEKKDITGELHKEEKDQKVIIETPSSEKEGRDVGIVDFNASKKKQNQEASVRTETFSTTSYIGKQIKTSIPSQPIEGNTVTSGTSFSNPTEESALRNKEVKDEISKLVRKLATDAQLNENRVSVITLTGDNKGASMSLSWEPVKKEARIHIHRGYKTDPDDSTGATTDGEAPNGKIFHPQTAPEPKAYVNSNAQGLNNSIVIEASVSERNPGVHFFLTLNASEAVKVKTSSDSVQTRRAECRASNSERLTHESSVRRRCLRGLFMESSDSDNPNKPRRHGCRYSCEQKNKHKEFM